MEKGWVWVKQEGSQLVEVEAVAVAAGHQLAGCL